MSFPLWFQNLLSYSLQIAGLALAGGLLPRALRLRAPRALYFYWQALLAVSLLLPLVEPWQRRETAPGGISASRLLFDLAPAASHLPGLPVTPLLLVVLVGGIGLRLGWLALGLTKLACFRQTARRIEPLPRGIQEIATRLGVAPEFCLSEQIPGPVTFGLWRPMILLPSRFAEMDRGRQQAIASHELLHVVRRDWVMNMAEEIVLAGFWFHPVVWWLVGRIRLSREQVVDQQVVELTGVRKPYLHALVEIAAGPGAVRGLVAPAFLKECQLAERIRSLIKEDFMSKRRIIISLVCIAVLTLLAGLAVIRKFPLKTGAPPLAASHPIQAAPEIFSVGNGVSAPVPIYKVEPQYTKIAKDAKVQGTVVLNIVVDAQGNVSEAKVIKSLDKGLDESAVNTVKTWKFKSATKNGKPVACKVMVEVTFRLF